MPLPLPLSCLRYKVASCIGPTCWKNADNMLNHAKSTISGTWSPPAEDSSYALRVVTHCKVTGMADYDQSSTPELIGLVDRNPPKLVHPLVPRLPRPVDPIASLPGTVARHTRLLCNDAVLLACPRVAAVTRRSCFRRVRMPRQSGTRTQSPRCFPRRSCATGRWAPSHSRLSCASCVTCMGAQCAAHAAHGHGLSESSRQRHRNCSQ